MSNKQLTIWFDAKGDMLDQAGTFASMATAIVYKSEEAKDFDDRMEYVKIETFYRKDPRVYVKSATTGRKYSMFIEDFDKLIAAKRFINNQIEGTWHFIKKGSGQALKLVLPTP